MHENLYKRVILALALITGGCFASKPDGECLGSKDCDPGSVCYQANCRGLCNTIVDCGRGEVCIGDGVCLPSQKGVVPTMTSVAGNGAVGTIADALLVTGAALDEAFFDLTEGPTQQRLIVRERSYNAAELELPSDVRSGSYALVASNTAGSSSAAVTLTLPDLTGDQLIERINATGSTRFDIDVMPASVREAVEQVVGTKDCPAGYTRDPVATSIVLCKRGNDEMVKVGPASRPGGFWVDRYEATVVNAAVWNDGQCNQPCVGGGVPCEACTCFGGDGIDNFPDSFPDGGSWTTPLYACSRANVQPTSMVTWLQAQQACTLAGKRLLTNEEWQAAVAGTVDPAVASDGTGGTCLTNAVGARDTGAGSACRSSWGAEDMIGNLSEYVSMWAGEPGSNGTTSVWPDTSEASYLGDAYAHGGNDADPGYGTAGSSEVSQGGSNARVPAVGTRGGGYPVGTHAGKFSFALTRGPGSYSAAGGFRCGIARQ